MSAHRDELTRRLAALRAEAISGMPRATSEASSIRLLIDSVLYTFERLDAIAARNVLPEVDLSRSPGVAQIMVERARQIVDENYDADHDDEHDDAQLAWAAVCYAAPESVLSVQRIRRAGAEFQGAQSA